MDAQQLPPSVIPFSRAKREDIGLSRWRYRVGQMTSEEHNSSKNLVAHTIIPCCSSVTFKNYPFVAKDMVLDLILHSRLDQDGNVDGLMLRAYKSSYDELTNTFRIGGTDNLYRWKDLAFKPGFNTRGRTLELSAESGLLTAGLDMEAERQHVAAMRRKGLIREDSLSTPNFALLWLGFYNDEPQMVESTELCELAFDVVAHGGYNIPSLVSDGNNVSISSVTRGDQQNPTVVELVDGRSYILPAWANIRNRLAKPIKKDNLIADLSLPLAVVDDIRDSVNGDVVLAWQAVKDHIGKAQTEIVLNLVWNSFKHKMHNITLMPHYLVGHCYKHACGLWRDLSGKLGKVLHDRNGNVARHCSDEGRISVWPTNNPDTTPEVGAIHIPGGHADLTYIPDKWNKTLNRKVSYIYNKVQQTVDTPDPDAVQPGPDPALAA